MLKPNIRGISRSRLSFSLHGWRNAEDNSVIKHRWLWSKSWLNQLADDPLFEPVLARTGFVYLLGKSNAANKPRRPRNFSPRGRRVFLTVLAISIVIVTWLPNLGASSNPTVRVETSRAPQESCHELIRDPATLFESWLSGEHSVALEIRETSSYQVGGFALHTFEITCDSQTSFWRVTAMRQYDTWQLKNYTRIEN
jgi:hypothetical protein